MQQSPGQWLRRHYPYAVAVAVGLPLVLGDFALFIVAMAGAIVALPAAYGPDVDEIAARTLARKPR